MKAFDGQPEEQETGNRRALSIGLCIFLITLGAVLRFAVRAGTTLGLNLHVVGLILILSGLLGLILPRLTGIPTYRDKMRRWVIPKGSARYGAGPGGGFGDDGYGVADGEPMIEESGLDTDDPTLADEVLSFEKDPPL
jgi:hypothetical protein